MPAAAQGVKKIVAWKRQTGLGSAASGSGGTTYRRRTSTFSKPVDTFENDEIVSHQQSTGVGIGGARPNGKVEGLLSPGAYSDWISALLRKDFASVTAITGLTLTVAASGSFYTVTRSTGSFLTDGIKIGHIVRLSGGTLDSTTINKNLLVVDLTATIMTVYVLNKTTIAAQSAIASTTVTPQGKTSYVPTTSHTAIYYTFEEYYSDITRSETYPDAMIAKADINLPASGNTSASFDIVALNRVLGGSQVLTTPSAAAGGNNDVMTGAFGALIINGAVVGTVTGLQFSIDGKTQHGDLVLGSVSADDHQRGRVTVTGQFTAKFDSVTLQSIFDAGSVVSLVAAIAEDLTATADCMTFCFPTIKLTGDAPDDGERQIIRTYPFTAQYNAAGGSGVKTEQTILQVVDTGA